MPANHPVAIDFKPSEIEFSATIYEFGERGDELEVVVIRFSGSYGYGSAGNGDARYMIAIRDYVVDGVVPHAIVFDLRELSYQWGNAIWEMFRCDEPFATLVSDRCSGFQTCGVARPMFESLEPAFENLKPPSSRVPEVAERMIQRLRVAAAR